MALAEYVVTGNLQSKGRGHSKSIGERGGDLKTWSGAKETACGLYDSEIFEATTAIVLAWSTAEAILGFRQLFPGMYNAKCLSVLKSSMTEE